MFQNNDLTNEGMLSGATDYTGALATQAIGKRLNNTFVPEVVSVSDFLSPEVNNLQLKGLEADVAGLDEICDKIREEMNEVEVSEAAIRKLLALAMVDSPVRFDLAKPGNEDIWLSDDERRKVPWLLAKLESRLSCPVANSQNNEMDRHVARAVQYMRKNADVLHELGRIKACKGEGQPELDILKSQAEAESGSCYLNMDKFRTGATQGPSSCQYAVLLPGKDEAPMWVMLQATEQVGGKPKFIAAELGVNLQSRVEGNLWPGDRKRSDCVEAFDAAAQDS